MDDAETTLSGSACYVSEVATVFREFQRRPVLYLDLAVFLHHLTLTTLRIFFLFLQFLPYFSVHRRNKKVSNEITN